MTGLKIISASFFKTETGNEPVRDWLNGLSDDYKKKIGDDIRTAEFGWPVGMPLCRSINSVPGLWEIRTDLGDRNIARTLFCTHRGKMVLLHGIIKKSQKLPQKDRDLAAKRMRGIKNE